MDDVAIGHRSGLPTKLVQNGPPKNHLIKFNRNQFETILSSRNTMKQLFFRRTQEVLSILDFRSVPALGWLDLIFSYQKCIETRLLKSSTDCFSVIHKVITWPVTTPLFWIWENRTSSLIKLDRNESGPAKKKAAKSRKTSHIVLRFPRCIPILVNFRCIGDRFALWDHGLLNVQWNTDNSRLYSSQQVPKTIGRRREAQYPTHPKRRQRRHQSHVARREPQY